VVLVYLLGFVASTEKFPSEPHCRPADHRLDELFERDHHVSLHRYQESRAHHPDDGGQTEFAVPRGEVRSAMEVLVPPHRGGPESESR
jgi:hypothetical protein